MQLTASSMAKDVHGVYIRVSIAHMQRKKFNVLTRLTARWLYAYHKVHKRLEPRINTLTQLQLEDR